MGRGRWESGVAATNAAIQNSVQKDAAGREEKDLPRLNSTFQTKPVSLIPTPRSYIKVHTSL